jgi:hypothetical protein
MEGEIMPQSYSTQYEFNEEIAARAVDAFIKTPRHRLDEKFWKGLKILVVITGLSAYAVYLGIDMELNLWSLVLPLTTLLAFGSLLVIVLSLHFFSWAITRILPLARWNLRRMMMKPFRDLGDRTVRWVFTEERFEVHLMNKDREIPWDQLGKIRIFEGFWALDLKKGPSLMLPDDVINSDIQNLIRRKAEEVGVQVVDVQSSQDPSDLSPE